MKMKKIFVCVLAVLICLFAFSACTNSTQSSQQTTTQPTTDKEQKPVVVIESPPDDYIYDFDSYNDIVKALTIKNTDSFETLRREQVDYGKVYNDTLSAFGSGNVKVVVPQIDGENIKLRDEDGFSNIFLMTSELYNLPWIWYNCVVDGYDLRVQVSYTSVLGSKDINSATSYLEVLSLIATKAPTPDNFHEYENYKKIYEKEITLADGRKVTAMISELKDSSNVYVMFYQDGMLIILDADNQLFTDKFWSLFSMAQY